MVEKIRAKQAAKPKHSPLPAAPVSDESDLAITNFDPLTIAEHVCRSVAELPDRNSPEGEPDMMLVTGDELLAIVIEAFAENCPPEAAAPRSAAPGWMPIETAPKEVELLGWREDCGPLLIMHTSFDRFATEKECDETDEETLFQKDWFGAGIPGGMERLEGSEVPTLWRPIDPPAVAPSEGGKQ